MVSPVVKLTGEGSLMRAAAIEPGGTPRNDGAAPFADTVVSRHARDGGKTVTGAQRPGAPNLDNASAFLAAAGLRLTHVAADRVEA
jgi:hypothetical protein